MTSRSTLRLRRSDVGVLSRLHDRDLEIASVVAELTVATTSQLARLYFGAPRVARRRLSELVDIGVLERFKAVRFYRPRPGTPAQTREPAGTSPWHYVLGELGARLIGALRGEVIAWRPEAAFKLARSQRLSHYVAVAEFYTALRLGADIQALTGDLRVTWHGEAWCASQPWARVHGVIPDAFIILKSSAGECRVALEIDRGSETLRQLRSKLVRYRRVDAADVDAVAFCFDAPGRETEAAKVLWAGADLPVVTTTLGAHRDDPLGPIWHLVEETNIERPRYSLAELVSRILSANDLHP
jgi:hypothetical protein